MSIAVVSLRVIHKAVSSRNSRPWVFCKKRCCEKFLKIFRKTPVSESLFLIKLQVLNREKRYSRETSTKVFSWKICKIFKNTFFDRTLQLEASYYPSKDMYEYKKMISQVVIPGLNFFPRHLWLLYAVILLDLLIKQCTIFLHYWVTRAKKIKIWTN